MDDRHAPEPVGLAKIDGAPVREEGDRQPRDVREAVGGIGGGGERRDRVREERGPLRGGLQRQPGAPLGLVEPGVADGHAKAVTDQLEQTRVVGAEPAAREADGVHDPDAVAIHRKRDADE